MRLALNEGVEPEEPVEPRMKSMRASAMIFGEEANNVGPEPECLESGSPGSPGSTIRSAAQAFHVAQSHGVRLTLRGDLIEWAAERTPIEGLLAVLRGHKAGIIAILRGDSCRSCGCHLAWPSPVGVTFVDGTSECLRCADEDRRPTAVRIGQTGKVEPTCRDRRGNGCIPGGISGASGNAEG